MKASGTTSWLLALAGSSLANGERAQRRCRSHRQPRQRGQLLDGHLHLLPEGITAERGDHVPHRGHNLRVQLEQGYYRLSLGGDRGDAHERLGRHRGYEEQVLVERFGLQRQLPDLASPSPARSTWHSPPVSLTSGHSYAAIAEAKDNLGNTATSSPVDFSYLVKTPPPTVTITYPVSGTTYGTNWTGTFTGTASAGTGATISKTLLSIEDTTTKLWWNGSAFSASSQTWITVTGTTTWMYTPSAGLTSGKSLCRHG